jgi:hypothetical protein
MNETSLNSLFSELFKKRKLKSRLSFSAVLATLAMIVMVSFHFNPGPEIAFTVYGFISSAILSYIDDKGYEQPFWMLCGTTLGAIAGTLIGDGLYALVKIYGLIVGNIVLAILIVRIRFDENKVSNSIIKLHKSLNH